MNNEQKTKCGFTLVEMLVVIAIVAVLATLIVGVASRIETREKEKHCRSTLALLTTALAQFHEYGFVYKDSDYTAFKFPLDCNGFDKTRIEDALGEALGDAGSVTISDANAGYSGNEVMYLLLSMVPSSRATLEKIDRKLIASRDATITIDGRVYPLFRVLDPWDITLRYDYYEESIPPPDPADARTFPVITSAGPDKEFGTADDITSRD